MYTNEEIFAGVFDNLKQHCLLIPPVNLNRTFLQNLNVKDKIVPLQMESIKAAEMWSNNSLNKEGRDIDLLFIDGGHFYDSAYQDISL